MTMNFPEYDSLDEGCGHARKRNCDASLLKKTFSHIVMLVPAT